MDNEVVQMTSRIEKNLYSIWFMILAIVAAACLITANTVAVKLVFILGFVIPGGALVYPITFIVDDIITEVYGYHSARLVIWFGLLANLIFVIVSMIVLWLPVAPYWDAQEAYARILGYTPRLLAAAFLSYLVGSFANAIVMSRLKVITNGRSLWVRAVSSTFVGQGLDSFIFVTVAYVGTVTSIQLWSIIVTVWFTKVLLEVLLIPFTYASVYKLKQIEGKDVYDHGINYTPFGLGRVQNSRK